MAWISIRERLPQDMQPVFVLNQAHRGNIYLALYHNYIKGFVLVLGDDYFDHSDVTHWHGVKMPKPLARKRKSTIKDTN